MEKHAATKIYCRWPILICAVLLLCSSVLALGPAQLRAETLAPVPAVAQESAPAVVATAKPEAGPRNVILLIGDGMDDQQITIARNYLKGATGRLTLDTLPQRSIAQVLTVSESNPQQAVYVADSANSATAIASGQVTSRGRIGTSAGNDQDLQSIVELATAAGIKTGLISTASVTDATIAAFYAHISFRHCQNPLQMNQTAKHDHVIIDCAADRHRNGGTGSIAEQLAVSALDLALGGGLKHFKPQAENHPTSVRALAEAAGFRVLTTPAQLRAAPLDQRWLGLFADGTLPVKMRGENNRSAEKPTFKSGLLTRLRSGKEQAVLPAPISCEANPAFADTPSLQMMTARALEKLGEHAGSGFFLMIESASIDKQAHFRNACGSIGEVEQLDQALDTALAFAASHPQTLIIVTADHGQAAQLVPANSLFKDLGVHINTPGKIARIRTPDNTLMVINYATNDFAMEEHTGVSVPVLTNHTELLPTTLMQTDLFKIMTNHLGLPHSE